LIKTGAPLSPSAAGLPAPPVQRLRFKLGKHNHGWSRAAFEDRSVRSSRTSRNACRVQSL